MLNKVKDVPLSDKLNEAFDYAFRNTQLHRNEKLLLISIDNSIIPNQRPSGFTELNCQVSHSNCLDQTQNRTGIRLNLIFRKEIGFFKKEIIKISEVNIFLYLFHNFKDIGYFCSYDHNKYLLDKIKESIF